MSAPVHVVGVRHHSPACARLARDTIRALRPSRVLIEGPADMSHRVGELALEHRLPVAIFSYYEHEQRSHSCWTPLCDYSPEWVALKEGIACGAEVCFIDLPAWTLPFRGVRNRYSDRGRPRLGYIERLCRKLGVDGLDALWDHLFEQPMSTRTLRERLDAYFDALRRAESGEVCAAFGEGDRDREAFMAQHIAHAAHAGAGPVVVICGGYHKPFLEDAWVASPTDRPTLPVPEQGARHGSYLVPYSFRRLDSFTGYEAGMPSPAYYQALFEHGPTRAGEIMLERSVARLRDEEQPVSAADLVAAETMTRGLMRLRGHEAMSRVDLLDGMAAALLQDAQDVPFPWTERGPLRAGTDPLLVEVLAALSGSRVGALAAGTPRPPLVADVHAELERRGLLPVEGELLTRRLDLTVAPDLDASRVLHRLRVLQIPGFSRLRGPSVATDAELIEEWEITRVLDADSKLVEAAALGATLEGAAGARLEEMMRGADGNLEVLAHVLAEALFVGLDTLARQVAEAARAQVHLEPHLGRLGASLSLLLALYRHDTLLGAAGSPELGTIIEEMVSRGLWLFEGRSGPEAPTPPEELRAVVAIRDSVKYTGVALGIDMASAASVMRRRAVDPRAPPGHRGAALGYLWSTRAFESEGEAREHAARAIRGASRPTTLGELLGGLFATAREEVVGAEDLVGVMDEILREQPLDDFLIAIPSLRLAFQWFPPRERDAIARIVLRAHGEEDLRVGRLRTLAVDAASMTRAVELERHVDAIESRFGLDP